MARFAINGRWMEVDVPPDTPLLWVIRDHLRMTGTKFGCGAGLCGACTVHLANEAKAAADAIFACQTEVSEVEGKYVTTIEGLSSDNSHPLQKAWIAEQVPQCGYCQSGQIMRAAALLKKSPQPTREEIVKFMKTNLCRCGTYNRIIAAVERASRGA
jgi:isoquinoline 1-oxidoreductase subunit alpha